MPLEITKQSPVLGLESPGAGPVELERGGTLLLPLQFGFFSMVFFREDLRPSSGERASELSSIKRGERRGERVVTSAGQATKALDHFCQTRRLHYGDILTAKQQRKIRDTVQASQ